MGISINADGSHTSNSGLTSSPPRKSTEHTDDHNQNRTDADKFHKELTETPMDQEGGLVDTWSDTGWGAIAETFGCAPCHFVLKEPDDSSEDTIP
jgi:hypothetical protein